MLNEMEKAMRLSEVCVIPLSLLALEGILLCVFELLL